MKTVESVDFQKKLDDEVAKVMNGIKAQYLDVLWNSGAHAAAASDRYSTWLIAAAAAGFVFIAIHGDSAEIALSPKSTLMWPLLFLLVSIGLGLISKYLFVPLERVRATRSFLREETPKIIEQYEVQTAPLKEYAEVNNLIYREQLELKDVLTEVASPMLWPYKSAAKDIAKDGAAGILLLTKVNFALSQLHSIVTGLQAFSLFLFCVAVIWKLV